MKKTMFITSVIMVVVMAIALTTSSLAWFTVDGATTVSTSPVSISAKAKTSTGLYISNNTTSWQQDALTLTGSAYNQYVPVVPYGTSSSADAADLLNGLQNDKFVTNTVKVVSGGQQKWANEYSVAATNFYKDQSIYVANSGDAAIAVSAAVSFTDVHGAKLYVAVLAKHQSTLAKPDDWDENHPDVEWALSNSDWKLIALACSGVNGTPVVPVGKYADADESTDPGYGLNDYFQENALMGSAYALEVAPGSNLNAKTPFNLARRSENDIIGDYMQVKVLAWYSENLTNTNSGSYYGYENGAYTSTVAKAEGSFAKFTVTFSQETANS